MKKYELLKDDHINYEGRTLYRIKALKDFGNVKAGDIGGYVESENNLSHEGDCWIYNIAQVFENAIIHGNATIHNNAKIHGNAEVTDYATIRNNARVYDNVLIFENAKVYNDATICYNAKIFGNAQVYDKASIYGHACIFEYSEVYDNSRIYGNAQIYGHAIIHHNARIHGCAKIHGNSRISAESKIYGSADIFNGNIISTVSLPYKDIVQYQCHKRILSAILTEDDKILYSIGCQHNITEKEFVDRIYSENGGLEDNPHRKEYLKLIKVISIYFKKDYKIYKKNMLLKEYVIKRRLY